MLSLWDKIHPPRRGFVGRHEGGEGNRDREPPRTPCAARCTVYPVLYNGIGGCFCFFISAVMTASILMVFAETEVAMVVITAESQML
jgi:hypothetical protein